MKYTIELKYVSSYIAEVDANDEGDALEKARVQAENADMNEFSITEELNSQVIRTE